MAAMPATAMGACTHTVVINSSVSRRPLPLLPLKSMGYAAVLLQTRETREDAGALWKCQPEGGYDTVLPLPPCIHPSLAAAREHALRPHKEWKVVVVVRRPLLKCMKAMCGTLAAT